MSINKKHPLAFSRVIDKIYIPEQYDKRKKLTAREKDRIRELYASGEFSHRSLADAFQVSPSTIQQTVNEKARQDALKAAQRYRQSPGYVKPPQTMELRYRKKELIQKGVIKI